MSHLTAAEFHVRFPNTGVPDTDLETVFLLQAEEWLNSCLAENYTVPFSSNNTTAKRIGYSKAFHLLRLRSLNPDDSDEMGDNLQSEVDALNEGKRVMMLSDGTYLQAAPTDTDPGQTIWSNTMTYKPTFDEDDTENQKVDGFKITNLRSKRV